jgi:hypothetical protein
MKALSKSVFLTLLALVLFPAAHASAAKFDTPWTGAGTSATTVVSDGTASDPRVDYNAPGAYSGDWTSSVVAGSTRPVALAWEASGFYSWFHVKVRLERFIRRGGIDVLRETLVQEGPTNCCSAPSGGFNYQGITTFDVKGGDVYGFKVIGSHATGGPTMSGSLMVHEPDYTAPQITPVVTGQQGENGIYTGTASVKWNVQDDGSPVSAQTGCEDATVDADTAGKTFKCTAGSRGGKATQSVTIVRDTLAPGLTVPAATVKQADGPDGATVTYDTPATDAIAASPKVECIPASGSRFPLGTTTVTCTAKDAAGNATTKAFDAIVFPGATPQAASPSPAPAPAPVLTATPGLQQINAVLAFRFTISKQTTRLVQLRVKNVPAGATVTVTCKGSNCPKKLKGTGLTTLSKGTTLSLATLVKTGLKSGTTINVSISSPGAVTSIKSLVVRRGKAPLVTNACRPPGASKPVAC